VSSACVSPFELDSKRARGSSFLGHAKEVEGDKPIDGPILSAASATGDDELAEYAAFVEQLLAE